MKHVLPIICLWCILLGCLDTAADPRPGPVDEADAEIFDVRTPPTGNNTGSGYGGSGNYQSGTYADSSPTGADAAAREVNLDAEPLQDVGIILQDAGEADDSDDAGETDE